MVNLFFDFSVPAPSGIYCNGFRDTGVVNEFENKEDFVLLRGYCTIRLWTGLNGYAHQHVDKQHWRHWSLCGGKLSRGLMVATELLTALKSGSDRGTQSLASFGRVFAFSVGDLLFTRLFTRLSTSWDMSHERYPRGSRGGCGCCEFLASLVFVPPHVRDCEVRCVCVCVWTRIARAHMFENKSVARLWATRLVR